MSLADLLAALAVLGLLLAATLSLLQQGQQAYAVGAAAVESQQGARVAVARLTAELRQAGAGDAAGPAVVMAEPTRVVFRLDANGDGVVAGPSETIEWFLGGEVLRRSAGAGGQPVVNGVTGLAFEYRDAAGRPAATPEAVREVAITLTVRSLRSSATAAGHSVTTIATRVRLRNR